MYLWEQAEKKKGRRKKNKRADRNIHRQTFNVVRTLTYKPCKRVSPPHYMLRLLRPNTAKTTHIHTHIRIYICVCVWFCKYCSVIISAGRCSTSDGVSDVLWWWWWLCMRMCVYSVRSVPPRSVHVLLLWVAACTRVFTVFSCLVE